jgi:hypothetical protein
VFEPNPPNVLTVLRIRTVEGSPLWVDVLVGVTTAVTIAGGADYLCGFRSLVQARQARRAV